MEKPGLGVYLVGFVVGDGTHSFPQWPPRGHTCDMLVEGISVSARLVWRILPGVGRAPGWWRVGVCGVCNLGVGGFFQACLNIRGPQRP